MINIWSLLERARLNPYPVIKPFLFCLDPEDAHNLTVRTLGLGLGPAFQGPDDPILKIEAFGLTFPNPIGLAAGLDKQATAIDAFMGFGFGSIEIGGVTPMPQPGNPRPRMVRVPTARGLINRFGFNSVGAIVFAERMKVWRAKARRTHNPVGINLGKNKETTDDAADYVANLIAVGPYADFVTINVSSPNTPGLRDLQGRERLTQIVQRVVAARDEHVPHLPVLVKVALELDDEQQRDVAAVALQGGLQGIIVGNTTTTRPDVIPSNLAKEAGGFSGPVMLGPSNKMLANIYRLTEGKIPLIGDCGVFTGADAYAKIRAGATIVQVYTALIYEGPLVIQKIKRELADLLRRDGFKNVAEAVGVDAK
jgi:dihydroorotate dehydrogenase